MSPTSQPRVTNVVDDVANLASNSRSLARQQLPEDERGLPAQRDGRLVELPTGNVVGSIARRATITVEEAASLLGIGRSAAYDAARRGQLPTRRLGRRLLVPVPAFLAWLGASHEPPE